MTSDARTQTDPPRLRILGRSSSHFTRVVRIVARRLDVPHGFDVLPDILGAEPSAYGGHPAMKIPVLFVDDAPWFGTESICRTLAEHAGCTDDPSVVLPNAMRSRLGRNAHELLFTAMSLQVQLVLGVKVSRLAPESAYFHKAKRALEGTLRWLDTHLDELLAELPAERAFSVFEIGLFCLVEHVAFQPVVSLEPVPRLVAFAAAYGAHPWARETPYFIDTPGARGPSPLVPPALDPATVAPRTTSAYPRRFHPRVLPREKRALGDALGLTQFGVNLTTLPPGTASSLRHHHALEDEFVWVVDGELVLRTDAGEQTLRAGMAAGFPAGGGDGHQLVNRGARPARLLEIGSRAAGERAVYPDDDLVATKREDGRWRFTRRDGDAVDMDEPSEGGRS